MPKKTKTTVENVAPETSKQELPMKSQLSSTPPLQTVQDSPTSDSASQQSFSPATSAGADGAPLNWVSVPKEWVEAVEVSLKTLSAEIVSLKGGTPNTPVAQNGQPQRVGWKEVLQTLIDMGGKIIEKIPQQSSNLEQTFAQRYMNLLDTAYGRYIPPGQNPLVPVPQP